MNNGWFCFDYTSPKRSEPLFGSDLWLHVHVHVAVVSWSYGLSSLLSFSLPSYGLIATTGDPFQNLSIGYFLRQPVIPKEQDIGRVFAIRS